MEKDTLNNQIEQDKMSIMANFLQCAPFDRWSESNLKKSAKACGHDENYLWLLFPQGIIDFTIYFHKRTNQLMTQEFLNNPQPSKISDKIVYLIELKIKSYQEHKEAIRCLIQYSLLPQNIIFTNKLLWRTCDHIWHLAGDKSSDYNYYTKRSLLNYVYSTSLLYWLDDESKNHIATKRFIHSQIQKVMSIGKLKKTGQSFLGRIKRIWNNS